MSFCVIEIECIFRNDESSSSRIHAWAMADGDHARMAYQRISSILDKMIESIHGSPCSTATFTASAYLGFGWDNFGKRSHLEDGTHSPLIVGVSRHANVAVL